MCGRFGLEQPELSETRFQAARLPGIDAPELYVPRFNIAPSQDVLTVAFSRRAGSRALKGMRWGLTSSWALAGAGKPRPINIKSESLIERPPFRRLLAEKRCLIPADGFYEWKAGPGGKQPWTIGLKRGELFGFAGIWDACKLNDGWLVSCAILTTRPNAMVAQLHDRMPVILRPEDEAPWLDQTLTDPAALMPLLEPLPADDMDMYPVPPLVNDVRNEGPELRRRAGPAPAQLGLT